MDCVRRLTRQAVRDAGLARPRVNESIGRYVVDFAWPRERVVVETDGWAAHGTGRRS